MGKYNFISHYLWVTKRNSLSVMYCYGNTVITDELWFSMHECMVGVGNLIDTQMCIIKGGPRV